MVIQLQPIITHKRLGTPYHPVSQSPKYETLFLKFLFTHSNSSTNMTSEHGFLTSTINFKQKVASKNFSSEAIDTNSGNYQVVIKSENQETYLRKQMEKKNRKTETIWWHTKHEEVDQSYLKVSLILC